MRLRRPPVCLERFLNAVPRRSRGIIVETDLARGIDTQRFGPLDGDASSCYSTSVSALVVYNSSCRTALSVTLKLPQYPPPPGAIEARL